MTSRFFFTSLFSLALVVSIAGVAPITKAAVGTACTDNSGCNSSAGEWCGDAGTCTDYNQCLVDLGGDATAMDVCATLRDNATVFTGGGACADNPYSCNPGSYCSQVDFSCNLGCSETDAPCTTSGGQPGACGGSVCVGTVPGDTGGGTLVNGDFCARDSQCASGFCEWENTGGTCMTDPGAGGGTPPVTTGTGGTPPVTTGTGNSPSVFLHNPLNVGNCTPNGDCLAKFLESILTFVVRIGTIVVILMLVFVGYKFVAARGEPSAIEEARSMLLWTVVGGLILLGAVAIAKGILATVQALAGGN